MKTIFVIGGCGFIGRNLIKELLMDNENYVVCIDNLSTGKEANIQQFMNKVSFTFAQIDIKDEDAVFRIFNIHKPEIVFHLAAEPRIKICEENPIETFDNNVKGTLNVLEASKRFGTKRFVFASSCHDSETKLVTKRGLIHYKDIRGDDIVFTLNKDGFIEENQINNILIYEYDDALIKAKGKRIDFATTPNHKIWYISSRGNLKIKTSDELNKIKKNSYVELFDSIGFLGNGEKRLDKYYIFSIEDFFLLAGMFIGDGFLVHTHNKGIAKTGLLRKDYLKKCRDTKGRFKELESNPKPYSHKYTYIQFAIPNYTKDKGRNILIKLLNRYNIKFSETKDVVFVQGRKDLNSLFEQFGRGAHNKNVPHWMLNYPTPILKKLFDGLMLTDGSKRGTTYHTVSPKLKDDFVELCLKIGYLPSVVEQDDVRSVIKNRIVERKHCYRIYVSRTRRHLFGHHFTNRRVYKGDVWCLNVPNGNFLIERNGKYAFLGNSSVYGIPNVDCVPEYEERKPLSHYAIHKVIGEELCKLYWKSFQLETIILRLFNCYGEYQNPNNQYAALIPKTIQKCLDYESPEIYGDGLQTRDFVNIKDVVRAFISASEIENNLCYGDCFNIGTGIATTISHTVNEIQIQTNTIELDIKYRPKLNEVKNIKADIDKAKELLNWEPLIDLPTGLKRTIEFYEIH